MSNMLANMWQNKELVTNDKDLRMNHFWLCCLCAIPCMRISSPRHNSDALLVSDGLCCCVHLNPEASLCSHLCTKMQLLSLETHMVALPRWINFTSCDAFKLAASLTPSIQLLWAFMLYAVFRVCAHEHRRRFLCHCETTRTILKKTLKRNNCARFEGQKQRKKKKSQDASHVKSLPLYFGLVYVEFSLC